MRDITPPKWVTSPTWATLSPCKLALSRLANLSSKQSHVICLVNCTEELVGEEDFEIHL